MRHLKFLPLTYLAGVHGFLMFAPYLALVMAGIPLIRRLERLLAARAAAAAIAPAAGARQDVDMADLSLALPLE